jgi:hypothetical protein
MQVYSACRLMQTVSNRMVEPVQSGALINYQDHVMGHALGSRVHACEELSALAVALSSPLAIC